MVQYHQRHMPHAHLRHGHGIDVALDLEQQPQMQQQPLRFFSGSSRSSSSAVVAASQLGEYMRESLDEAAASTFMVGSLVKDAAEKAQDEAQKKYSRAISNFGMAQEVGITGDPVDVHFLGEAVIIDDQDAAIVLVFPKGKEANGKVNLEETVHKPFEQAHKIFWRQHNSASEKTLRHGFETFQGEHVCVTMQHYQEVVRYKLLQLFKKSGLKVSTFTSVDGDEVFAKLSLARDGHVIKHLAQRFSYSMPFKQDAYRDVKEHGIYQGHKPMMRRKKAVVAYTAYDTEIADLIQEFRPVDEIRIVMMQLHSLVSLEQLKHQGIITKYFAAAKHQDVKRLHERWLQAKPFRGTSSWSAMCLKVFEIPSYGTKDGLVRDFFGEEVAFFFRWHAFYTKMLLWLGLAGMAISILRFCFTEFWMILDISFCCIMVMWAGIFNQLFRNRMSQAEQEWGMKDFEVTEMSFDRADYIAELEGTWRQMFMRLLSISLCILFCVSFIGLISFIEERKREEFELGGYAGKSFYIKHGSVIVVGSIKVTSIAWGYIAPLLAKMQNHRTQARFDDGLTNMLAFVKIFVTLWNFIYLAFVKVWTSPTCDSTLEAAARHIWGSHWDDISNETLITEALRELNHSVFSYTKRIPTGATKVCIRGCYPRTPEESHPAASTNCSELLRSQLVAFFFVHILYTVFFLVFPLIKVKFSMMHELFKAKRLKSAGKYSWLQFQAKCPPYEYLSWGGSRVDDFLECAIGFALITCFGILYPMLTFFAFLANMVEFRLLAYRMVHVTRRPMPNGASGIGTWQSVMESTSSLAIVVNSLLIVFVMYPMRSMKLGQQLVLFIVLEHVLLGIRYGIDMAVPDVPLDVRRVDDFNAHFKRTVVKYPDLPVPKEERYDREYTQVNLSLLPAWGPGSAEESSDSGSDEETESVSGSSASLLENGAAAPTSSTGLCPQLCSQRKRTKWRGSKELSSPIYRPL